MSAEFGQPEEAPEPAQDGFILPILNHLHGLAHEQPPEEAELAQRLHDQAGALYVPKGTDLIALGGNWEVLVEKPVPEEVEMRELPLGLDGEPLRDVYVVSVWGNPKAVATGELHDNAWLDVFIGTNGAAYEAHSSDSMTYAWGPLDLLRMEQLAADLERLMPPEV